MIRVHWLWTRWLAAREHHRWSEEELELSHRLLEESKAKISPVAEIDVRNQFSAIIRDGLRVGYPHHRDTRG